MASCAYCGATLLWVKKRAGNLQFCNDAHLQMAQRIQRVPEAQALELAAQLRRGPCPVCKGNGPVDVHVSHTIWSALILTRFQSTPTVSCRTCGIKAQTIGLVSSFALGWWGFPWGIIMTPIQVVRNVVSMTRNGASAGPSPALRRAARLQLAARMPMTGASPAA